MNIAMIFRKLNVGGTQRHALSVAVELKKQGHAVTLYALYHPTNEGFSDVIAQFPTISLRKEIHHVPQTKNLFGRIARFFENIPEENADARALARMIDLKTDILNPHHDPFTYKTAYYYKKYVRQIPSIWMMNDLTTKYGSFMRAHALHPERKLSMGRRIAYALFDWWEMRFIRNQDAIMALDQRDADWAQQYFHTPATVVHSGIDADQFPYHEHKSVPKDGEIKLLMVGIFFEHRRFEDTLDAMAILKKEGYRPRLTLIGRMQDQRYYDVIEKKIFALNLEDDVRRMGSVSEEALRSAYKEHDIFIFPSHMQSWGIAVVEAMASGIPVIVSRTTGAADVLADGDNALLVNPKSPQEIAAAIKRLVRDPELFRDMPRRARAFVETSLTWSVCADKFLACFEAVMKL